MKLTILEAEVKGYEAFRAEDRFVKKKRGKRGPALRVIDDNRGQLSHLQRKLVPVLWHLTEKVEVEDSLLQLLRKPVAFQTEFVIGSANNK